VPENIISQRDDENAVCYLIQPQYISRDNNDNNNNKLAGCREK
jgi:hypothetical protein